jgi:hypothetical protein
MIVSSAEDLIDEGENEATFRHGRTLASLAFVH